MAKRKPPEGGDIPEWVVTYGDLMSLLLCFFILIVAFSEPKKPEEFRKVLEKIREALGFRGGIGVNDLEVNSANAEITVKSKYVNRGKDGRFTDQTPRQNITGAAPKVTVVEDGDLDAVGGSIPFAAGSAELSLDGRAQLRDNVAPKIRDKNYIVRIVGHSSGREDLTLGGHHIASFERAKVVHDYLIDECGVDPLVLRIELAADYQPSPESNGTSAPSNRRVQVYLTDKTIDEVHPDPFGTGRGQN